MSLIVLTQLLFFTSCVDENSSSVSPTQGPVTNPDFSGIGLNIKTPTSNLTVLDKFVISGHCSNKKYPVKITSASLSKTIYSICQDNFTWAAAIDGSGISTGSFSIEAQIFNEDYSTSSSIESVTINRGTNVCSANNASDLFANAKTGGNGTTLPYIICNSVQFSNIRFYPDRKFVLGQDIDFANKVIAPIATPFKGELDGQGFQVSNFIVKDLVGNGISVGLFKFAHDAIFKNLNLKGGVVEGYQRVGILAGDWRGSGVINNVKIQGRVNGVTYVGGLTGLGNTSLNLDIDNLELEVEVVGNNYVGGLIGHIVSLDAIFNIKDAKILSKVNGDDHVGGVIGRSLGANLVFENIQRIGDVKSFGHYVGGFIGEAPGVNFFNVENIGNIETTKDAEDIMLGGLAGYIKGTAVVTNSSSTANLVSGGHYTGGLLGKVNTATISNSYSRGNITVLDDKYNSVVKFVGGLVGGNGLDSTILNSRSYATINAKAQYVGGLVGIMNGDNSQITNSYYKGDLTAYTSNIGGLVGVFNGNSINSSFSEALITAKNPTPSAFIGGILGQSANVASTYSRLYSRGDINIQDGTADNVGGIAGSLFGSALNQAYFVGSINGARSKVGGIAGISRASISDSYFQGTINSNFRYIGGIAGIVQGTASVSDVFVKANLFGQGEIGGIIGWYDSGSSTLDRSYYIGDIVKLDGGIFLDNTFGGIIGLNNSGTINNSFRASTNSIKDASGNAITANLSGSSLTTSQLRNTIYYTNFDFENSSWSDPVAGFKLPFVSTDYLYATFDWLKEPNQGFLIPEVFSFDPLQRIYASIFIQDVDVLSELDQQQLEILDSSDPLNTVLADTMTISVEEPSLNGKIVAGKKLIYGECGKVGYPVFITGDFQLTSICQENNRWAAVVDISILELGNINFLVQMKNYDASLSSNQVARTMIKTNDLCDQNEALSGTFANSYLGADGDTIPFKICHSGHFSNMAYYPDKNYEIVNDIDFGGSTINPIQSIFTGNINGNGYTIKNFSIHKTSSIGVGLFRIVKDSNISNLKIKNADVKGYERVGILAGSWVGSGSITDVSVEGRVEGILYTGGLLGLANTNLDLNLLRITSKINVTGNGYTGGLLGHISTLGGQFSATDITLENEVTGLGFVGGLIGSSLESNLTFSNVSQNKNVTGTKENIGGIAGLIRGGNFTNITNTGNVTNSSMGEESNTGGLFGLVELTTFNLNTATFNGDINAGGDNVGGIVGKLVQGTMTNLQNQGNISVLDTKYNSVRSRVGGLVGFIAEDSSITNSFSNAIINVKAQFVGGLVGRFDGKNSILTGSSFGGAIDATTAFVGGVAGFFFGKIFKDNYSTGNITISNPTPNSYIGGIVGYANSWTSDYQRIYATGDITISNGTADYVGGLIGYFRGGALSECYATGNVTGGRSSIGGLVGLHRGSTRFCFSSGNIDASFRHAGGLIGYLLNGSISDSFSVGNIVAKSVAGGILGYSNTSANQVQNVYALGSITRLVSSSEPLTFFGPIIGEEVNVGSVSATSAYFLDSNIVTGHNLTGIQTTNINAQNSATYIGYDFSSPSSWRMPAVDFILPGEAGVYLYPIHEWLGSGSVVESYNISGTVSGLNFGSMKLDLNGVEQITVNQGATNFSFTTQLSSGTPYNVTVTAMEGYENVSCNLSNRTGFMGSQDITTVGLSCASLANIQLSHSNPIIGIGDTLQLNVTGTMSNALTMDITNLVNFTSSNQAAATISTGGLVTGMSVASTIISADIVGLSSATNISVYGPIFSAQSLGWTQSSPHNTLTIQASWTKSVSGNLAGQEIALYETNNCSSSAILTQPLLATDEVFNYTALNTKVYSYTIKSISLENVEIISNCSSELQITLDPPAGVTNLASSAVWVKGNSPINSPTITWTKPTGVNIKNIKVALGSSFGSSDIVNFSPIGINTSHVFSNLNLIECAAYFPSVIVQDNLNLESSSVTDTLGFRWDNTAPNTIVNVGLSGDATQSSSPEFSWSDPGDNCALNYYELGIGTTVSSPDITGYKPVGNVSTYTAVSGLNGFNLNLIPGQDYYTFVRAVDYAGNKATMQVSAAWQVIDLQASLPSLILWLDSSDKSSIEDSSNFKADNPSFNNRVNEWLDISGSTNSHNFRAVASESEPYFSNDTIFFNGSNHVFTTDNHAEINLATVSEKNISFAFRTENNINNTQVIYEEGGTVRGMNIYISGGNLYCGFWNINDDGDGSQAFVSVSAPISQNKTYSVSWVFDYSNYTGPTGADGTLECFLNNNSIGTASSTTRVFPHSGAIGIGGMYSSTYYHTGAASGDGNFFRGEILEVMISNQSVDNDVIKNIHNYLLGKWASDDLSKPNNLAINNNATVDRSATATWQAIDPNLMVTSYYEIAIGQTPGGTEDLYWLNIGNTLSYQVIDGINSATLTLSSDVDYYLSVRAVDSTGSKSQVATSDSWRIFDFSSDVTNIVLHLSALNPANVLDAEGDDGSSALFSGQVDEWLDLSSSTVTHSIMAPNNNARANYVEANSELVFDGVDDGLAIANSPEINTQLLAEKNITIQFSTGSDVTSRQVLYEEGGASRGMNIYISAGKLYCGFWNVPNDGDGSQPFIALSGNITASTDYVVTWRFDYSNFTGAGGEDGKLDCFLNTQFLGSSNTTTRIYPHSGAIGLGYKNSGSYFHDTGGSSGTSDYFEGSIKSVIINNDAMRDDAIQGLHNFLVL